MKLLIENFPDQLIEAVAIAKKAELSKSSQAITQVLISGLGGSGIGGTIANELAVLESPVPIVVSKGYFVPAFVNENTLVIISSFSGNTEETLNALELALAKNAKIVCITSGGKIAEIAKEKKLDLILLPPGNSPRACLGYSLTQLLKVFHFFGVIKNNPLDQVLKAADLLKQKQSLIIDEAKKITAFLKGKIPVIYTTTYREGIAIRFRQQINENAKMLCWHHVVPEMNHNELVGWTKKNDQLAVIYLRDKEDYIRNQKRIDINKEIISKYTPHIYETWSEGNSPIEKAFWHIHVGDWASWFLSVENNSDAVEVKVIDFLKSELSKF